MYSELSKKEEGWGEKQKNLAIFFYRRTGFQASERMQCDWEKSSEQCDVTIDVVLKQAPWHAASFR